MKKEELKARRKRLHQIYVDHDVEGFRAFLGTLVEERPEVSEYLTRTPEELSELMYSAKATLLYFGDEWQEARNRLRAIQFFPYVGTNLCVTCHYFRDAPEGEAEPCVQLGATPADTCCPGYLAKSG